MRLFRKKNRRKLTAVLYPDICPYCREVINHEDFACEKCRKKFKDITYKRYAKGGYPCVSAAPYDDFYATAIRAFKFHDMKQFDYQFALSMAKVIKDSYQDTDFDFITFVPLHRKRLKERGYNQSELLAICLSEILNIPCIETLIKTRNTKPQHKVKGRKRAANVKGAYKAIDKEAVINKTILLIDDIITTGNTLGECAKTLGYHHSTKIYCATFAETQTKTT